VLTVCAECTKDVKIIMEILSDMGPVQSGFGLFCDSVSIGARKEHGSRQMYPRLGNHLGRTRGTPR
jgi:hypothetical protein